MYACILYILSTIELVINLMEKSHFDFDKKLEDGKKWLVFKIGTSGY